MSTQDHIAAAQPDGPSMSGTRRAIVVVLAFLLFVPIGAVVWRVFVSRTPPTPKPASPAADPLSAIRVGWTELPLPPAVRPGSTLIWAGDQLLYWGGGYSDDGELTAADGFAFDPGSVEWRPLPQAPLGLSGPVGAWTGEEALFWEVQSDRSNGVAYDPATGRWRVIAPPPRGLEAGGVVVWTGEQAIAWGGGERESANLRGASYDPATDTWTTIADAPIGLNLASGMWTGEEMLVFGSLLSGRNIAETDTSVGAAYDPSADRWRRIAPSELSAQATSAVWVGDRMVAWDYEVRAQVYDPRTDRWSPLVEMPLRPGECYPDSAALGSRVFANFCGTVAEYDAATGDWTRVHGGMADVTVDINGNPMALFHDAQIAAGDDVAFLLAQGITMDGEDVPCYGCNGSPTSFWAYRPGLEST